MSFTVTKSALPLFLLPVALPLSIERSVMNLSKHENPQNIAESKIGRMIPIYGSALQRYLLKPMAYGNLSGGAFTEGGIRWSLLLGVRCS